MQSALSVNPNRVPGVRLLLPCEGGPTNAASPTAVKVTQATPIRIAYAIARTDKRKAFRELLPPRTELNTAVSCTTWTRLNSPANVDMPTRLRKGSAEKRVRGALILQGFG